MRQGCHEDLGQATYGPSTVPVTADKQSNRVHTYYLHLVYVFSSDVRVAANMHESVNFMCRTEFLASLEHNQKI